MPLGNTRDSWGWPARAFHWVIATLMIGMLGFGFYLTNAFNPGDIAKLNLVQLHKSFGFVVFVLVALRMIWRAFNPPPEWPDSVRGLQRRAVQATHGALYVLMFVMPVSGWLTVSASPLNDPGAYPVQIKNMVFGLFEMPDAFNPGDRDLSELFAQVHYWSGIALVAIVALHVAGAAYHAFVEKDGVVARMIRGRAD